MHRYGLERTQALQRLSLCLTCLLISGCPNTQDAPKNREPVDPITTAAEVVNRSSPYWVVQRQEGKADVAIVFVHGLFGDAFETWTHANGTRFFDLVAADPVAYGKVDILAYGYPSDYFTAGSFDIQAAANALHARLVHHDVLTYRKVVFVGHSMGGLVIMRELLMNRAALPQVPVIVLLSTPQEGADVARIADYIARNPALSQLTDADSNDLLQSLNDDWRAWPERPKVRCAYENMKTKGVVMVVKWASGTRFCDAAVEVQADHLNIVKPDTADHLSVITVTNALKEFVFNPALEPRLETPDFAIDGERLTFQMTSHNIRAPARVENAGGSALTYSLTEPSDPDRLLLWPHRPERLDPKNTSSILFFLVGGADKPEYRFTLQTDYGFKRTVVVRAPAAEAVKADRVAMLQGLNGDLLNSLQSGDRVALWRQSPAEDNAVGDAVIEIARAQVAKTHASWPKELQYVIAADLLNDMNWHDLSERSLRLAVRENPAVAEAPSVQRLATLTSSYSGKPSVISSSYTAIDVSQGAAPVNDFAANPGPVDAALLSGALKSIPALQFYGLSLEGDVKEVAGDKDGAQAAYTNAASIRRTPSVKQRLEASGGWAVGPDPSVRGNEAISIERLDGIAEIGPGNVPPDAVSEYRVAPLERRAERENASVPESIRTERVPPNR